MATIVQPYNPWREQMAAGIIVPMVTDMIRRNQERADNRLRNEAIQRMISGDGALTEYMTPEMALPEMPAPKLANQAGMMSRLANVLGERRYSGLDTATMTQLAQPYIAEAEAARKRQEAADFAAGLPTGAADMGRYLTQGMMRGVMPESAYNGALGWLQTQTPKFGTINTGDHVIYGQTGPDGRWTEQGRYSMGMSPEAAARTALGWAEYGLNREQFERGDYWKGREFDENRRPDGISTSERWRAALEMKKSEIENLRQQQQEILKSLNILPGEGLPPDVQTQLKNMRVQELKLVEEYNALLYGQEQGAQGEGLPQDEGYDALPDEWKQKAEEWRKRGYEIQVHWYGENQVQIFASNPRDRDSMTQINKGHENIKRVKRQPETPESMIADMAVASGDVSPESYAAVVPQTPASAGATPQAGGRRLSREQYEKLVATAESGADPEYREAGITTRADVENWLRFNGYSWE